MIKINGETFIVTGGLGFIGSHIVEELERQDKKVLSIDIRQGFGEGNIKFDVTKTFPMYVKPDAIFHEACSKCTVCRDDPFNDLMVNAWGTWQVADYARKIGAKVVHASTGSVYGDNTSPYQEDIFFLNPKTIEETQYAPKSFYGVSKLAGEQYLRAFEEYYGLRYVGLRYFHVFGPRQDAGLNGGVVAIFITKMLKGEPIVVFGDGNQTRSFTYAKDVVAANFHAANSKAMEGQYYNVASGIQVSLNQLIDSLADIIGVKPNVEYFDARKGDIKYFNVSNAKLAFDGYCQWSDFEDALKETVGWYRGNIS